MQMLQITAGQYKALQDADLARFRSAVAARLKKLFPEDYRDKSNEDIHAFVVWGIAKARSYGMTLERDVARFIELVSGFGEDFDRKPETSWMHDILSRETAPAAMRLDRLTERLAFGAR